MPSPFLVPAVLFSRVIRRCLRRPGLCGLVVFCLIVAGWIASTAYSYQAGEMLLQNLYLMPEDIALLDRPTCHQSEEDPTSALCSAADLEEDARQQIPRMIHQTYKTGDVPPNWLEAYDSCIALHPASGNWTHLLWTDEGALDFIAANYTWFLDTYVNYPYAIQRADAIRYFILYHYGGVYLDLDVGCRRDLSPLLAYDAFFPKTEIFGVSNDVMGAIPFHPLLERLIHSLSLYSHNYWFLKTKYLTVLFSTGPVFVSREIISFLQDVRQLRGGDTKTSVRILHPTLYSMSATTFFAHYDGSTWHGRDVLIATYVWHHKLRLTAMLGVLVLIVYMGKYGWGIERALHYYRRGRAVAR